MPSTRLGPGYTVVVQRIFGSHWAHVYHNGYTAHTVNALTYDKALQKADQWIASQTGSAGVDKSPAWGTWGAEEPPPSGRGRAAGWWMRKSRAGQRAKRKGGERP